MQSAKTPSRRLIKLISQRLTSAMCLDSCSCTCFLNYKGSEMCKVKFLVSILLCLACSATHGYDFYVSPDGSDLNPATKDAYRTITPDKNKYRKAIKDKFAGRKSYDPAKINDLLYFNTGKLLMSLVRPEGAASDQARSDSGNLPSVDGSAKHILRGYDMSLPEYPSMLADAGP